MQTKSKKLNIEGFFNGAKIDRARLINSFVESEYFCSDGKFIYEYMMAEGCWMAKKERVNLSLKQLFPKNSQAFLTSAFMTSLINDLLEHPGMYVNFEAKKDANLLNVLNGVVDLSSGALREHRKEDYFDYVLKFRIEVNEKNVIRQLNLDQAPTMKSFLESSLQIDSSPSKRELFFQMMGYAISDCIGAKKMFWLVGAPNSGKSLILKLLESVVGIENRSIVSMHEMAEKFKLCTMFKAKINLAHETRNVKMKALDIVKKVAANEQILVEQKGKDAFEIIPRTKLLFCANSLPPLGEYDNQGIVERLVLLCFPQSILPKERDLKLLSKIMKEIDVVFTLAVQSLIELKKNAFIFVAPDDSIAFIQGFAREQNSVKTFIEESCVKGENYRVHYRDLLTAYRRYCTENALKPCSDDMVKQLLISNEAAAQPKKFKMCGSSLWGVTGIGLKVQEDIDDDLLEIEKDDAAKYIEEMPQ